MSAPDAPSKSDDLTQVKIDVALTKSGVERLDRGFAELRADLARSYVSQAEFGPVKDDVKALKGYVSAAGKFVALAILGAVLALLGLKTGVRL